MWRLARIFQQFCVVLCHVPSRADILHIKGVTIDDCGEKKERKKMKDYADIKRSQASDSPAAADTAERRAR